jgi:7-cyano-7-deazaguanine synthase
MKAAVLLSGGLDSTVAATQAAAVHGASEVVAVHMQYGQKHKVERESAEQVAEWLGLGAFEVVDARFVFAGGAAHSTLLDGGADVPELTYEQLEESEGPSATYVPLRNPVFVTIAAAKAMIAGAGELWLGVHAEDAARDAYPDCRADCIGALGAALYIGSYHAMRVVAPLAEFTKADVVCKGIDLGAPLHLTHSCYNGARPACGKCPTCMGRLAAFTANGVTDPIAYA